MLKASAATMFDAQLRALLETMANEGISHAAQGFADMVGKRLTVSRPDVCLIPLAEMSTLLGGPESEAVGIYLRARGDISSQIMLVLSYAKALELVDLILGEPSGATRTLGTLARSALSELGNLTGSFFLNAVAASTGLGARPLPPAVMVDMVGAILDIVVTSQGGVGKHVLMLHATFLSNDREVQADFWVIPDPATLQAFTRQEILDGNL